jgi:hypothetical protein
MALAKDLSGLRMERMGHSSTRAALIYLNSRELHQLEEKSQVSRSQWGRNSVLRLRMAAVWAGAVGAGEGNRTLMTSLEGTALHGQGADLCIWVAGDDRS